MAAIEAKEHVKRTFSCSYKPKRSNRNMLEENMRYVENLNKTINHGRNSPSPIRNSPKNINKENKTNNIKVQEFCDPKYVLEDKEDLV